MKTLVLSCGALATAFTLPVAFPTAALADNKKPTVFEVCTAAAAAGLFGGSEFACELAISQVGGGDDPVDVCKSLKEAGYGTEFDINLGQCVSFLRNVQNENR